MICLLEEIARVRSGYSFRGRIEEARDGTFRVVQIKDVSEGEPVAAENLARTNLPDAKPDHLLRPGDVLFASRGARRQAVLIEREMPNTIFGSQFFACESGDRLDPAYLAWYLNQRPAQRYFEETAVGSKMRIVTKEALERLEVILPPFERQRKIAEVYMLSLRERRLVEEIRRKREHLVEAALLKSIHT